MMFGSFDDDLMGTDGLHHIVHPIGPPIEFSLDPEEGKFVGDDADRPSLSFPFD